MKAKLFWVQAPMRDKGFVISEAAGNAHIFETAINEWLEKNPNTTIHHIQQSACGGSFSPALWLISVWYTASAA